MKRSFLNLCLVLALLLIVGLACSFQSGNAVRVKNTERKSETEEKFKKIEGYTIRNLQFAYYQIPPGLSRAELIDMAREIHAQEPNAQLILVDDDSGLDEYVTYAKAVGDGREDAEMPKQWADRHIVANLQKYLNGKWMLCEGRGYEEIAEIQ
jgi:hypothetical protein